MLRLMNAGIKEILHRKKDLIIYGASLHLQRMLEHFPNDRIAENIRFIVDRDKKKEGTEFYYSGHSFPIVSLESFLRESDIARRYHMIMVIERYEEALYALDHMPRLDKMICYIWWIPFLSIHSEKTLSCKMEIPVSKVRRNIPKVIHYCWFGGGEMPDHVKENIASWKSTNPEFEIREWNEDNFDVNAIPYISEAYKRKKYSFVADFARYEIVLQNGGFYFDTDVELLRDISSLCSYRGFFSFEYFDLINSGSGFAAEKGDMLIKEIRNQYLKRKFVNKDGSLNLTPCSEYETGFFKYRGLRADNSFQVVDDFLIFPYEFFAPVNQGTAMLEMTENTYGIHKFDCSWFDNEEKNRWSEQKRNRAKFNERLIEGWKER